MADEGGAPEEQHRFFADRAKTGRAGCKKCKQKIEQGSLRMAKAGTNPFGSGMMKMWHHVSCMFEVFAKQRASTAKIECLDDIGGWDSLAPEDQEEILSHLPESAKVRKEKEVKKVGAGSGSGNVKKIDPGHKDCSMREFRRLCADIANHPSYTDKTAIINKFITKGSDNSVFKGDLLLTVKLLLPGVIKRIYNLQSKQIIKLFSRIFGSNQEDMLESLEEGDVAETIRIFFESSKEVEPSKKSILTLQDVDSFLERLSTLTKEDEQINHFISIVPKCTGNDLKMIIRFIKHDLRIYAGAKHVLEAVHPDAYQAFQASRDLNSIMAKLEGETSQGPSKSLAIGVTLLTPILPMLAQACKSAEEAISKCPNGMFADIKYDGERVQVHKKGTQFKYYSRSLKPVLPHKVASLEQFIPKAFPFGQDLILDCEILLMNTISGKPLPFGTLGVHKKNEFKDATVCLFVFDCIYYNGESLTSKPIKERRKILQDVIKEVPHRVVCSEMKEIYQKKQLEELMIQVFKEGLEGLVLKDMLSIYEPGKRHWLKVKKDYLFGGAMADTADLVVLGAWYGTGQKGGMMSVFLMGCFDEDRNHWCTVTKVHTGHDDATLDSLQSQLDMVKISKDMARVPSWLRCTKTMVPDFVARDPKAQPVWEITGAELTKHVVHTADGISIRFPRVTRIRGDKDWETATSLRELKALYKKSKETTDFTLPGYDGSDPVVSPSPSPSKGRPVKRPSTPNKGKDDGPPKKKTKYELQNPLPEVFNGIKLWLPLESKLMSPYARSVLPRYIVAFGGTLLKEDDEEEATHFVIDQQQVGERERKRSKSAAAVSVDWIFSSLSSGTLQPVPPLL